MDSKKVHKVKKVSIQELMRIAVKKYNMNDDITFSKLAIEKFMRDIFCDENSLYSSYVEKVSAKYRQDKPLYKIDVTDETINLVTNLIVLYNMAGPVILKSLILENKFKKNIFDERINKIENDIRQLELLAANQDVLYKMFEEHKKQEDNKRGTLIFNRNNTQSDDKMPFSDFIKSIDIIYKLSSSKISSSKHLNYEDIQLLLYPNKLNIENDKDKLIRDIEISMYHNQFSLSEEMIDEALLKYPDEIILYYLKFKFYYKAERLAARNFNIEYFTEDNRLDHPELCGIFIDEALSYQNKIIDILLKILELWPEDKRTYKQINYDEILYHLIKYRNKLPAEYEILANDEEVDTSCYTEQFFKDSYEFYKQECKLYDNGNVSYSYDKFKENFLNKFKDKERYISWQNPYIRFPFAGCKYQESEKDKKILYYLDKFLKFDFFILLKIKKEEILQLLKLTSPENIMIIYCFGKKS